MANAPLYPFPPPTLKPLLTNPLKNAPFPVPYLSFCIVALLKPCATLCEAVVRTPQSTRLMD